MINAIKPLIDEYHRWLSNNTYLREINQEWVEITTPYLDRHNDYFQIFVSRDNGGFLLTDDGYTINDLRVSGCDLSTPKRARLLEVTLNGFGIQKEHDTLIVKATSNNFAYKKHNLIQAMVAVNDLFYLAEPTVASLFREDVERWLVVNKIRFVPRVKFTGRSGFDHFFDFAIPQSNGTPERIVKTINRPTRDMAQTVAFSWLDTKNVRPENSKIYAFLNDAEAPPPSGVVEALESYEINPVIWSKREEVKEFLSQ